MNLPVATHNLKRFAQYALDNLDASESTKQSYAYRFPCFLNFIEERGFHSNTLLEFKRHLEEKSEWSVSTKNAHLIAARVFLNELHRSVKGIPDITKNVKVFREDKKHKRNGMTRDEIRRISDYTRSLPEKPNNERLRAIVALLSLQGLRQIEVVRLDVEDFNEMDSTMAVRGKGRDDKELVDLHPETVRALCGYIEGACVKSGPLFFSVSNNTKGKRLTTRGLRDIVASMLRELEIKRTPHGFRHWFTTELVKSHRGDITMVQEYTRHASLETLQRYNDSVKKKSDLPVYYKTFSGVSF